jgi:mannose-6-phosphate isomerase-like protein (cupin superfamily)
MLVKKLGRVEPFRAGDLTELRELLHPDRDPIGVRYSLAHGVIEAGRSSRPHRLSSVEVYYFLSGTGVIHVGGEPTAVEAGDAVAVPTKATQWVENTGEGRLVFLCIVDPAWQEAGEEILGNPPAKGQRGS